MGRAGMDGAGWHLGRVFLSPLARARSTVKDPIASRTGPFALTSILFVVVATAVATSLKFLYVVIPERFSLPCRLVSGGSILAD